VAQTLFGLGKFHMLNEKNFRSVLHPKGWTVSFQESPPIKSLPVKLNGTGLMIYGLAIFCSGKELIISS